MSRILTPYICRADLRSLYLQANPLFPEFHEMDPYDADIHEWTHISYAPWGGPLLIIICEADPCTEPALVDFSCPQDHDSFFEMPSTLEVLTPSSGTNFLSAHLHHMT